MAHSSTLIGTITEKAGATWKGGEVTSENYAESKAHWIKTAKDWRDELQAEGLTDTVKALNKTIEFFEREG